MGFKILHSPGSSRPDLSANAYGTCAERSPLHGVVYGVLSDREETALRECASAFVQVCCVISCCHQRFCCHLWPNNNITGYFHLPMVPVQKATLALRSLSAIFHHLCTTKWERKKKPDYRRNKHVSVTPFSRRRGSQHAPKPSAHCLFSSLLSFLMSQFLSFQVFNVIKCRFSDFLCST